MNRKEVVLDSGIKLVMVNTDKFKTVDVRVFFEDDLNSRNITTNNLLLKLLSTKTKKYPSRKLFKDYLKDLYDMKIKVSEASYGEVFSFSIGVNSLNSRYTLNNENLLENEFIVLSEVLNNPLVNDNSFDNDYFNEMYKDYKESLIDLENYKEVVVKKKVNEILKDEKCLFELTDGTLNDLKDVTNEEVFKKYLSLNKMCKEVVVLGEINFDDVERYCKKYLNLSRERACFS
jgi:predicted Zn-dependent peptidase